MALGGKIFKSEIGNFFNFSLLCDIDQAHGFDELAFLDFISFVNNPLTSSQQMHEKMFQPFQQDTENKNMQLIPPALVNPTNIILFCFLRPAPQTLLKRKKSLDCLVKVDPITT